jgi:heptosyltransferase-2
VSPPRRILFVRLTALGDVLLATPAARALKRRFPEAEIDWLVEQPYLPLVAANPHVRAIAYEKRGRHAGASGLRRLRTELCERDYDLVVDLQGKPKTWYLRSSGRRAVAIRKRSLGKALLALLGRDPPLVSAHAVDLFLEALRPLGVEPAGRELELHLTSEMVAEAASLPAGRLVGIAPGARWETKRWPAERFAQVASRLVERGVQPLLIGGAAEQSVFAAVRAQLPAGTVSSDTSALSVGGLAAAIARCALVVTGDSGPAHIASALGVPVVAVFGPTSPRRWGPLSERSRVVRLDLGCSPCSNHGTKRCPLGHHDCLQRLDSQQVVAEALELLEAQATSGSSRGA